MSTLLISGSIATAAGWEWGGGGGGGWREGGKEG